MYHGSEVNVKTAMDKVTAAPRKFLFVSQLGLIHDLAWTVRKEGHAVKYYIGSKADRDVADGMVDKVDDWEAHQ
ncbi:MAG TPA: hypothetical protein VKW04_03765, partial [Planctomycetota bacterium]|nr:hypothetical protein [Planctomycetota bacterium]